ncbi:MAG: phosphatase PAP2 family protein [Candidatus Melainabacteria bacterium]|jgi:undecaprenyl-diphosphatase
MTSIPIDIEIYRAIHTATCSGTTWDQFNLFVTNNSQHIWFGLIIILALIKGKKGAYPLLMCFAGFFVAWHLSDEYLKPLFNRPRPFLELEGICVYGQKPHSFSFPSGHMLTACTMAMLITLYDMKNKISIILAWLFAFFVGYTRIYLGVHFPTDIIGGAFMGSAIAAAWYYSTEWARKFYKPELD